MSYIMDNYTLANIFVDGIFDTGIKGSKHMAIFTIIDETNHSETMRVDSVLSTGTEVSLTLDPSDYEGVVKKLQYKRSSVLNKRFRVDYTYKKLNESGTMIIFYDNIKYVKEYLNFYNFSNKEYTFIHHPEVASEPDVVIKAFAEITLELDISYYQSLVSQRDAHLGEVASIEKKIEKFKEGLSDEDKLKLELL